MDNVKNAVIMAAGMGTRLLPLTRTTPKPLLKVNGRPMIKTLTDALKAAAVENVYIVTGHLQEQFEGFASDNGFKVIENPVYRTVNKISSVYYASDVLLSGGCYICEADLMLSKPGIIQKKPACSCYYGLMKKGFSDDWVFETGKDGFISRVGKGGTDCFNMVGISYFTGEDAAILCECIRNAYGRPGYEELFWDEVVNDNLDRLRLRIYPVDEGSITEIDTYEEYMMYQAGADRV